jgi:predicted DNA-binding protein (MmcQ/YjbR family)
MARTSAGSDAALRELRELGLTYPGTHLKSPWPGHKDLAVNDKTFAYLSIEGEPFKISCKLPQSSGVALMLPFCAPTPYGLGKSGWVTATPPPGTPIPVDMFKQWIDESYRAQAPAKLVKQLGAGAPMAAPAKGRAAAAKQAPKPKAAKAAKAAKTAKRRARG